MIKLPLFQFTVNMKEAKNLSALKKAITACTSAIAKFQQEHRAYKFQIAVSVVYHKAVDPAVITQPPVVLTSQMLFHLSMMYTGNF